jgi:hypothetical protein
VKESRRPPVAGERCTCGRLDVIVFVTDKRGEVGWCRRSDGGRRGPLVFCGAAGDRPEGRCPACRLRLDDEKAHQPDPHTDAGQEADAQ